MDHSPCLQYQYTQQSLPRTLVRYKYYKRTSCVNTTSQHLPAKFPFSARTPGTNRNNGRPWEGLQENIAITSEAGFDLENPEVN